MDVIRARVLGFCMGVRRAVEMAEAELAAGSGPGEASPVFSLGPLIHNPQTLAALKAQGLVILDEDQAAAAPGKNPVVIIRAHGVSPPLEENIRRRGARIVDATCPKVRASQKTALTLAKRGFTVFIAGEKTHAEVKGIAGYVEAGSPPDQEKAPGGSCIIAGTAAEAEAAARTLRRERPGAKTALIAQTTLSEDEYGRIAAAIKESFPDLEIRDTICGATRERQDALKELCAACDAVVIAGGKESANTGRLLAIARRCGKPAWLAETAADLPPELDRYKTLGISAGASTPDDVIEDIFTVLCRSGVSPIQA
ncbi:MAG: 4-hydroxy-3-methylbut-2-enyl diphosphate reductase [Spirochaetaceae bacterium]|jgi:4-hydroxy-3-methylbut-2-enyl diphosphate reductase|nr:4-hydroxy-3-methylbut-2-enyl diphosphate reductase [Spirochaetaceae bacterium]